MKIHGEVEMWVQTFLNTQLDGNGGLHAPAALPSGKAFPINIE
jgi:hypothetical protein